MKLWPRKPFLLIFVSLACCCCKHVSHSEDLLLTHVFTIIWTYREEKLIGYGIVQGRKQQYVKSKRGDVSYMLAFFQSNKHVDFLIHHYPCFKFPRENTNSWEETVRHGSTTWHTQHGSMQQCQAWLLSLWTAKSPASGVMQWAVQVTHRPVEG